MSSQIQDPEDAREDTPLLRPTSPETQHADSGEQEVVHGSNQSAVQTRRARLLRLRKYMRILLWTELATSILVGVFTGVTAILLSYGRYWFTAHDYIIDRAMGPLTAICLLVVLGSAGNLLRMKNSNLPFPSLVNILLYGFISLTLFYQIADLFIDWDVMHVPGSGYFCSHEHWDEHGYNTPRGTWRGCVAWESAYTGIVITLLALIIINGLTSLGLIALAFVEVYLQRPVTGGLQRAQQRASWNIPVGYVSVGVWLRWGPPGRASEESTNESGPTPSTPDRELAGNSRNAGPGSEVIRS